MQHGSIPLDLDLSRLHRLLGERHTTPDSLADSVGWLNRWLRSPLSLDEAETLLAETFAEGLGVHLVTDALTARERNRADELLQQRYGSIAWTTSGSAGRVGLDR